MNKEKIFNILYDKDKVEVYREFLKIENNIENSSELYNYYEEIKKMLSSEKSYIRIRAFRLICKLSKHDYKNKINKDIDLIVSIFNDNTPTVVRQSFVAVENLILNKPELSNRIKEEIAKINYLKYKSSMSSLIKKDIDYFIKTRGNN